MISSKRIIFCMIMIHVKLMTFMFLMQGSMYGNFVLRYMVLIYGTISPYSLNSRSPLMFSKTTAASSYWVKVNCTPCYELNCTDDWNVNFISTWHHLIVLRRHTATFYFYFYFFSCLILFVFLHVLINMCLQRSRVISLVVFHCP